MAAPAPFTARTVETPAGAITIRRFTADDSIAALTELLHRAYAGLAALGFCYVATHQGPEVTQRRIDGRRCLVAERDGVVVGTITAHPPDEPGDAPWYDRPGVAKFSQFGVEPALHRSGIGAALLDAVEAWAHASGATELACDTAEGATHLIRWYTARGYRVVERHDWVQTNYESVILSRAL